MIKKILIANRGEIAIRVMRACREMGITTVAVYSEADKEALFTKYAGEAYCIGPPPATASYLNIPKVIEVAKQSGADAIHPGYGFLAENPKFARACEEEGIKFIGPSSRVLELMGDKLAARREMVKAGVPVVPGAEECVVGFEQAREIANEIEATSAQVALAWLLSRDVPIAAIPGTRRIERLEENWASQDIILRTEYLGRLESLINQVVVGDRY